ncbi:MAG: hypothetical protein WDA00_03660 [Eubacteriales bacterium]
MKKTLGSKRLSFRSFLFYLLLLTLTLSAPTFAKYLINSTNNGSTNVAVWRINTTASLADFLQGLAPGGQGDYLFRLDAQTGAAFALELEVIPRMAAADFLVVESPVGSATYLSYLPLLFYFDEELCGETGSLPELAATLEALADTYPSGNTSLIHTISWTWPDLGETPSDYEKTPGVFYTFNELDTLLCQAAIEHPIELGLEIRINATQAD